MAVNHGEFDSEDDHLEYCLYHVLVARLETLLNLDPCSAVKLSGEITNGLISEVRGFQEWEKRGSPEKL